MARSIRRGSSRMRSCGFPTPRIRLRRGASIPPKKSITSPVTRLPDVRHQNTRRWTVKSRRRRGARDPGDPQVAVRAGAPLDEIADDSAYEVGGSSGAFRGAAELRDETPKVLASAQGAKHPGGNLLRDGNRTLPRLPARQLSCDPVLLFGAIDEVLLPPHQPT